MTNHEIKKGIDRRSFLRRGAAVGAGLVLSPMAAGQNEGGKKSDQLNVALLGAGAQGQVLLNACLKIPNVRFRAVCDIWAEHNQKRASRLLKAYKHDVNAYVDYREMLDKESGLDAVIVATPDFWHAEHTIGCLKAGLHVYCEKEMSNTLEGARKMVQAQKETGKLLQIGHQRRSNPRYIYCMEKLIRQAKILGRITTVNGQWNRSARPDLGWPQKSDIDQATLEKYGFESMHQFRNWRWYRKLGGGPIVDLGSHQIDIYNWFLQCNPKSVIASGGTDYYEKKTHEWYDTVMAIFEYDTPEGTVRAYYQTLTTNSCGGYYETFMGNEGTLSISESAGGGGVYREQSAPDWDKWVKAGILKEPKGQEKADTGAVLDVRETVAPPAYELPVEFNDPYHKPHLENFFDAVRGKGKLNSPAETGFESAVTVLKVNEAVEAARKLYYKGEEFKV
ncbi:MAG TPA: Gfo/Idh/MocA family oxidoreductase [Sedimentisphaerales bacterium]|nr:Gfo/Idh/MocA family oxidoreductase [Sedimentisphaerales bacterium]